VHLVTSESDRAENTR